MSLRASAVRISRNLALRSKRFGFGDDRLERCSRVALVQVALDRRANYLIDALARSERERPQQLVLVLRKTKRQRLAGWFHVLGHHATMVVIDSRAEQ